MTEPELDIELQIEIARDPDAVFKGLLHRITEGWLYPDGSGKSLNMKLEAWPGGRWFRDLGNNTGHLWAHVQTIKPPVLLELVGPLCMSSPCANHVAFRLSPIDNGTRVDFRHRGIGIIPPEHRNGMPDGWREDLEILKQELES